MKRVLVLLCFLCAGNIYAIDRENYRVRDSTFKYGDVHRIFFETGTGFDISIHDFNYYLPSLAAIGASSPAHISPEPINIVTPLKFACLFEIARNLNLGIGVRYSYNSYVFNPTGTAFDSAKVRVKIQTLNYYLRGEYAEPHAYGEIINYVEFGSGLIFSSPSISYASPIYLAMGAGIYTPLNKGCLIGIDAHFSVCYLNTEDNVFSAYFLYNAGIGITLKY